ncbi:unnamed protein product [Cyclocybe aegerita]|uniref:Uncharacterized protein n=1 Tax=Cyclocybe aegerita TaxID=1973307 RepID=A0A8S0XMN7_CYCAE|nr:unnamed protein product [Cyclocybe aegerita]
MTNNHAHLGLNLPGTSQNHRNTQQTRPAEPPQHLPTPTPTQSSPGTTAGSSSAHTMHHDSTQNPPANRMAHNEDAQRLRAFQEENARLRAEVEALRNASNPRVNPAEQQHPQQHPPPQVIEAASDLRAPQQVEAGAAAAAATINQAPTRQALYEDEATVARIRESLAARKEEEDARKPQLPDIIPGFKANALNLAVPPKVDNAIKAFQYVPYSALTTSARRKAARGEEELVPNANGGWTIKGLDRKGETELGELEWLAAAKAAEERTRHHHGNARADALASHHLLVTDLGRLHGWEIALEYDRQQRDLWARYPSHDISTLDRDALTIIATQYLAPTATRQLHRRRTQRNGWPKQRQHSRQPVNGPDCAFDAALQDTCQQTAKPSPHQLVSPSHRSPLSPAARTLSSPPTTSPSASTLPRTLTAHSKRTAETTTAAASVVDRAMEQLPAASEPDPRTVFTPIDASKAESILRSFNLYNTWQHVIFGLRNGFDVGIRSLPTHTILFRQSCILPPQPRVHSIVHRERTCNWALLTSILTRGARAANWPLSHITHWLSSQAQLVKIPHDSGPLLPTQPSIDPIRQCWNRLGRVPYFLGVIRGSLRADSQPSDRLPCGDIRHFGGLSAHPHPTRPTKRTLHPLGWKSPSRQSSHVWDGVKCRSVRLRGRHASRYLQGSWIRAINQVGRRFLRGTATRCDMDRGRLHRPHSSYGGTMECREDSSARTDTTVHRVRLAPPHEVSQPTNRKGHEAERHPAVVANSGCPGACQRSSKPPWQVNSYLLDLPPHPPFPTGPSSLRPILPFTPGTPATPAFCHRRHSLGPRSTQYNTQRNTVNATRTHRHRLVGRCQYLFWNRSNSGLIMGGVAVERGHQDWPETAFRHRLGRGRSRRACPSSRLGSRLAPPRALPCQVRQLRCSRSAECGTSPEQGSQRSTKEHLCAASTSCHPSFAHPHLKPSQRHRRLVEGGYPSLPDRVSKGQNEDGSTTSPTPFWLTNTVLAFPILVPPASHPPLMGILQATTPTFRASALRPSGRHAELRRGCSVGKV